MVGMAKALGMYRTTVLSVAAGAENEVVRCICFLLSLCTGHHSHHVTDSPPLNQSVTGTDWAGIACRPILVQELGISTSEFGLVIAAFGASKLLGNIPAVLQRTVNPSPSRTVAIC